MSTVGDGEMDKKGFAHAHSFVSPTGTVVVGVCKRYGIAVCGPCGSGMTKGVLLQHLRRNHGVSTSNISNSMGCAFIMGKIWSNVETAISAFQPGSRPLAWAKTTHMFKCPECDICSPTVAVVRRHVRESHKQSKHRSVLESELEKKMTQTISGAKRFVSHVPVGWPHGNSATSDGSEQDRRKALVEFEEMSPLRKGKAGSEQVDVNVRGTTGFARKTRMLTFQVALGVDCEVAFRMAGMYQTGEVEKAVSPVVKELVKAEYELFVQASTAFVDVLRSVPDGLEGGRGSRGYSGMSANTATNSYPTKCARVIIFTMRCYLSRDGDGKPIWKWLSKLGIESSVAYLCENMVSRGDETALARAMRVGDHVWKIFRAFFFDCWCHPKELLTPVWIWVVCLSAKKDTGAEPCFSFLGKRVSPFIAAARFVAVLVGHRCLRTDKLTQDEVRSILRNANSPQSVFRTIMTAKNACSAAENQVVRFQVGIDPNRPNSGSVGGVTHDPQSIGNCIRRMQVDLRRGLEGLFHMDGQGSKGEMKCSIRFDWVTLKRMTDHNEPDESKSFLRMDESKGDYFLSEGSIRPEYKARLDEMRLQALAFARKLVERSEEEKKKPMKGKMTSADEWLLKSDRLVAVLLTCMNGCGAQSTRTTEMSSLQYKTGEFGFQREVRFLKGVAQLVPGFSKTNLIVGSRNLDTETSHILIMVVVTVLVVRGSLRRAGYVQKGDTIGGTNSNQAECFIAAHTEKLQNRMSLLMGKVSVEYYGISPSGMRHLVTGIFRQVGRSNKYGNMVANDAWLPESRAEAVMNEEDDSNDVHSYLTKTRQHSKITEDTVYAIEQGGLDSYAEIDKGRVTSGFVHYLFGLESKCQVLYRMRVGEELNVRKSTLGTGNAVIRSTLSTATQIGEQRCIVTPSPVMPVVEGRLEVSNRAHVRVERQLANDLESGVRSPVPDVVIPPTGNNHVVECSDVVCENFNHEDNGEDRGEEMQTPVVSKRLDFNSDEMPSLECAMKAILCNSKAKWRSIHQKKAAEFVWNRRVGGNQVPGDLLLVLPTGGGKSLVYQLTMYLMRGKPGLMLLLVPYKALTNQIAKQMESCRLNVVTISSISKGNNSHAAVVGAAKNGSLDGIILSLECMAYDENTNLIHTLNVAGLVYSIVLDEPHAVSGEKHFRRGANYVSRHLRRPGIPDENTPGMLAMSATVPPDKEEDMMKAVGMSPLHTEVIRCPTGRPNAVYRVVTMNSCGDDAIVDHLREDVRQYFKVVHGGKSVFFFKSIALLERVADCITVDIACGNLQEQAMIVTYHGQLSAKRKRSAYEAIMAFKPTASVKHLIVMATSGFGAGVDIPDIRWVYVIVGADNMEILAQEFGRGGRDGDQYEAELLVQSSGIYAPEDMRVKEFGESSDVCLRRMLERAMDGPSGDKDCEKGKDLFCDVCTMKAETYRLKKRRKIMSQKPNVSKEEGCLNVSAMAAVQSVHKYNDGRVARRDENRRFLSDGFLETGSLCHLCFSRGKRGDDLRHESIDAKCGTGICFDCCSPISKDHVTRTCPLKPSREERSNELPRCYYCGTNTVEGVELHDRGEFGKGKECPFRHASRWAHAIRSVAVVSEPVRKSIRSVGKHPDIRDVVSFDKWVTKPLDVSGVMPMRIILEMLTGPYGSGLMDTDPIGVEVGGSIGQMLQMPFPCGYCFSAGKRNIDHRCHASCRGNMCTVCTGSGHFAGSCPFKASRRRRSVCVGCGLGVVGGSRMHSFGENCSFRSWGLYLLSLYHGRNRERLYDNIRKAGLGEPPVSDHELDNWLSEDIPGGPRMLGLVHIALIDE